MPRKKSAQPSEGSSQPAKKLKTEAGEPDGPLRRSQRTKALDESPLKSPKNEPTRPKVDVKTRSPVSPRKGAGFVVTSPMKSTPSKSSNHSDSCPLELSVKVTPCDLIVKAEPADKTTDSTLSQRKRRLKTSEEESPPLTDKRSKLVQVREAVPRVSLTEINPIPNANHIASVIPPLVPLSPDEDQKVKDRQYDPLSPLIPTPDNPTLNRAVITSPSLSLNGTNATDTEGDSFSLVSYNILSEVTRKRCDYSHTKEKYLNLSYRHTGLIEELRYLDSDLVCLQEVDESYYNDTLLSTMKRLGYEGHFHKRVDKHEGSATFYRHDKFSLVSLDRHSYHQLACQDISRLEHSQEVKDRLVSHINYPSVLLVTTLRHNTSNKHLVIGNTHITYTKFKDLDISTMEIAYAFKTMVKSCRPTDTTEYPFILCGDFNTRIIDPGYIVARDGYLDDHNLKILQELRTVELPDGINRPLVDLMWCGFQHPARNIKSAYKEVQGAEPKSTSKNYLMDDGVDYMWSSSLPITSVTQINPIPNELPDKTYPSDHVSLRATYKL